MTRTDPIQCDIHLESQVRPLRFFKPDLGTLLAAAGASIFDAKSVRFPLEPRLPPIHLPPPLPFARLAARCSGHTARPAAHAPHACCPEDLMDNVDADGKTNPRESGLLAGRPGACPLPPRPWKATRRAHMPVRPPASTGAPLPVLACLRAPGVVGIGLRTHTWRLDHITQKVSASVYGQNPPTSRNQILRSLEWYQKGVS